MAAGVRLCYGCIVGLWSVHALYYSAAVLLLFSVVSVDWLRWLSGQVCIERYLFHTPAADSRVHGRAAAALQDIRLTPHPTCTSVLHPSPLCLHPLQLLLHSLHLAVNGAHLTCQCGRSIGEVVCFRPVDVLYE